VIVGNAAGLIHIEHGCELRKRAQKKADRNSRSVERRRSDEAKERILHLLLKRDGVSVEQLLALIEKARRSRAGRHRPISLQ